MNIDTSGREIINIGAYRLAMGRTLQTTPRQGECEHAHLEFIEHGEMLRCTDCMQCVTAVWAFTRFMEAYRRAIAWMEAEKERLRVEREKQVTLRAAQLIEHAWRSRNTVPVCPHCHRGILPPDNFGARTVRRENPYAPEAKPILIEPGKNPEAAS